MRHRSLRWSSPQIRKTIPTWWRINAAAAAVALSDIPFSATVGAVRVGRVNGEFVVNPTYAERAATTVNIMVVGHKDGIVMIESGAKEETEEVILAAIEFAHVEIKKIVAAIDELVAKGGKAKRAFTPPEFDEAYYEALQAKIGARLKDALDTKTHGKTESYTLIKQIKDELAAEIPAEDAVAKKKLAHYYELLRERIFREQVTKERTRPDRRAFDEIRAHHYRDGRFAAHPRFGAIYARRNPGAGYRDTGHDGRQPAAGVLRRRAEKELHAPLQLPALQRRRDRPHDRRGPPRGGSRGLGGARHYRRAAGRRRVALLDPHCLRHSGIQRLIVDGHGVRSQPGAL